MSTYTGDLADSVKLSYQRHPVDDLEPAEESEIDPVLYARVYQDAQTRAYRECAQRLLPVFNDAMLMLLANNLSPQAFWEICFGVGLPICEGRSMTELAVSLGLSRAAISKGAKKFQRTAGLPINQYLKPASAIPGYHDARTQQIEP